MPLGTGRIFPYIPEVKYSDLANVSKNRKSSSNIVGWLKQKDSFSKSKQDKTEKATAFGAGVVATIGFIAALKSGKGISKIFKKIKPSNLFKSLGNKIGAKKTAIKASVSSVGEKLTESSTTLKNGAKNLGKKLIKFLPFKK